MLIALHGSLQHEMVHGHPTRWRALNRLLGVIPLQLWIPFGRYRDTHHAHHRDARLTDPVDDPESFYWLPEDWQRLGPLTRAFLRAEQTLAGRVLIGPALRMLLFWRSELTALRRADPGVRAAWVEHILACVPVVLWLTVVCGMPLSVYFACLVLPGGGVQLIRSFAEHRARPGVKERVAIVEDSWVLGPLFLFNNLHSLHHEAPGLPWYALPGHYRRERKRLIAENGGLVYRTYFDVARRYLFRPHDSASHPSGRVPLISA